MSPESVKRLAAANGRRLLRVAPTSIGNEIELIFEALPGEDAELLITVRLLDWPDVGQVSLETMDHMFGPNGVSEQMPPLWLVRAPSPDLIWKPRIWKCVTNSCVRSAPRSFTR